MRYQRVYVESIGYELPPNVVTSADLEQQLSPLYEKYRLGPGQIEALTGIRERRFWDPGFSMYEGAAWAGRKALEEAEFDPEDVGMVVYTGVCRDNLEPATACAAADRLGIPERAQIYDLSNACLGVMNGMIHVANAIELGQVRAGLVISCESSRQIVELTVRRMLETGGMENFRHSLATMTGGSGAVGVLLTDESLAEQQHQLLGGVTRSDTAYHHLCRWGPDTGIPASAPMVMETDAPGVLEHGVALGKRTWTDFLEEMGWSTEQVDRVICHQVGTGHRMAILDAIGVSPERDFTTVSYLGNIGTVSLPITAAIAEQRGFLEPGQRVGFLGIGSGLNCLMLGINW
jgi:3-oxoacyl-[acyl-carrier-protein] synthase-3